MRLVIFGASGGVGRHLTELAPRQGHEVLAVVRPGSRFVAPAGVELREADVFDRAALQALVAGRDAVLSGLGLRRASKNPYSPITGGRDVVERFLDALLPVLEASGPRRLSMVSAAGVGDAWHTVSPVMRLLFNTSSVRHGYSDLANAERKLAQSALDWQAVRPTTLTDAPATGRVKRGPGYGLFARIPRADVAAFMLEQLQQPSFEGDRTPTLSAG